jgi:Fe-S-cluster containining protein
MSDNEKQNANQTDDTGFEGPGKWDRDALITNLLERLEFLASEQDLQLSEKRVRYQVEHDAVCQELIASWPQTGEAERVAVWKRLLRRGLEALQNIAKVCVRCGQCCRRSSPTLYEQDVELVRTEKIPLSNLVTLRKGEPVISPFSNTPFYLPEECIKIREKPGTTECVFLDSETDLCSIYQNRPHQCRVQACWDNSGIKQLTSQTILTRAMLFSGVDTLTEIMDDHDRRCRFELLCEAFDDLKESNGEKVDEVLDVLAFEDHYRTFMAEKLNLPQDALELFFGRGFSNFLRLFGFRIEDKPDGTRVLLPDEQSAQSTESDPQR